jgi:glycine/D-amino acid oxidase-like deaminating enzyme
MRFSNFWTDDYPRPADLPVADPPARVDVAIIGSGYTGLNAAMALRAAGASVAVLEAKTIGWGASSRNAGMATAGLKMEPQAVVARYGVEQGRAFWAWAQDAIDHVERVTMREGIDCHFVRSGSLTLAAKPTHLSRMRQEASWFAETIGPHDAHVVGPEGLAGEIGATIYHGAVVDQSSAALHPARYVYGLAEAAARHGANLVEDAPVTDLRREQGGWRVVTRRGSLAAQEVLLATNGYTTNLVPAARRGVFPAGSYIITTEPLPADLQREISPRGRMFFDSRHFLNYFRLTPDGRMLFGGRHDLSTHLDLAESARLLRERMVTVFPQLAGIPLSHAWTGKLGLTFDLMPHIGRVDGIWYAYGYAGHGVAIASKMGQEVGDLIAGVRQTSLFSRIPHRRYPWTPYDKLFLPFVSLWFRFLDKIS